MLRSSPPVDSPTATSEPSGDGSNQSMAPVSSPVAATGSMIDRGGPGSWRGRATRTAWSPTVPAVEREHERPGHDRGAGHGELE